MKHGFRVFGMALGLTLLAASAVRATCQERGVVEHVSGGAAHIGRRGTLVPVSAGTPLCAGDTLSAGPSTTVEYESDAGVPGAVGPNLSVSFADHEGHAMSGLSADDVRMKPAPDSEDDGAPHND